MSSNITLHTQVLPTEVVQDEAQASLPAQAASIPSLASLAAQFVLNNSIKSIDYYRRRGLDQHEERVRNTTVMSITSVSEALRKLALPDDLIILTVGSDSKEEKLVFSESPVELVVMCPQETKARIETEITEFVEKHTGTFDEEIEWKDPQTDQIFLLKGKGSNPQNKIIPSRYFHTHMLFGTYDKKVNFVAILVQQLKDLSSESKKKFKRSFLDVALKSLAEVCPDGIAAGTNTEVNLEQGTISYSGAAKKATKYSLLRSIQYSLDWVILNEIKKKPHDWGVDLLMNMPKSVPDKIEYIHRKGLLPQLSPDDVDNLKQSYRLGLFYFHIAQSIIAGLRTKLFQNLLIPNKEELSLAYRNTKVILLKITK